MGFQSRPREHVTLLLPSLGVVSLPTSRPEPPVWHVVLGVDRGAHGGGDGRESGWREKTAGVLSLEEGGDGVHPSGAGGGSHGLGHEAALRGKGPGAPMPGRVGTAFVPCWRRVAAEDEANAVQGPSLGLCRFGVKAVQLLGSDQVGAGCVEQLGVVVHTQGMERVHDVGRDGGSREALESGQGVDGGRRDRVRVPLDLHSCLFQDVELSGDGQVLDGRTGQAVWGETG